MGRQVILIIEDDLKVVELVEAAVKKTGIDCKIKIANNGADALRLIEKNTIDLALLDIHMPVMSGAQLLIELCNRKIWLPIIILTAYSIEGIQSNLMDYGIIDLLGKPLDIIILKEKIKKVLERTEHKDSITGLSSATIMQIMEMEQRTGVMTLKTGNKKGRVFFQEGKVIDMESDGVSGEEAMTDLLDLSTFDKEISIEYLEHHRKKKMNKSFTQVILNVSRLKDEKRKVKNDLQETDNIVPDKQHWELERTADINHQQLNVLVENLKKELISTAIWTVPTGQVIAGYNYRQNVGQVFTQMTGSVHEALSLTGYPGLGNYYIFDLLDEKLSVTIPLGLYSWGILIDSRLLTPEQLLKKILPQQISAFEKALS
jgi:DNA-binding response OmpR family regulator